MAKRKHTVEVVKPDFKIDEELELHETGWKLQRIGWVLMILLPIAGALGFFGQGLVSNKTVHSGNVDVEYERFFRYETEMRLLIESEEHINRVSFPQKYVKDFRIMRFVPEPENNSTVGDDIVYNFPPGQNQIVSVYVVPKNYGALSGVMTVNQSNTIQLNHFIFP